MGAPAELRLAWDSGNTDGDPGSGRVRIDTPNPRRARYIYVNGRDSEDALLDQLVPRWQLGDQIVIERAGAELNRIVAWITGPIVHGGSYYRIPVIVRSVVGNFGAHDDCVLTHANDASLAADPAPRPLVARPLARLAPARTAAPAPAVASPVPIIDRANATDVPVQAPCAACAGHEAEVAKLKAENAELLKILEELVTDAREVYVVEA